MASQATGKLSVVNYVGGISKEADLKETQMRLHKNVCIIQLSQYMHLNFPYDA